MSSLKPNRPPKRFSSKLKRSSGKIVILIVMVLFLIVAGLVAFTFPIAPVQVETEGNRVNITPADAADSSTLKTPLIFLSGSVI